MVSSSIFQAVCQNCGSNGMKTRRVDDDTPGSSNGSHFTDDIFQCNHVRVQSRTFCCNVYNPFSSKVDTIRWTVIFECKKCTKTLNVSAERTSTYNGQEAGRLNCCGNQFVWACVFEKWGHTELLQSVSNLIKKQ